MNKEMIGSTGEPKYDLFFLSLFQSAVYLVNIFILSLCQIIKMASVELLEFRRTEWINLLLAGSTTRRLTSMNHKEVMQKMMDQDDFERRK